MDVIDKLVDSVLAEERFKKGDRVRVVGGSGVDSDKEGVITGQANAREMSIKTDDGEIITMFKNRLQKIQEDDNSDVESSVDRVIRWQKARRKDKETVADTALVAELEDFVDDYWQKYGPDLGGETKEALALYKEFVMDRLSDEYGDRWPEIKPIAKKIVDAFNG